MSAETAGDASVTAALIIIGNEILSGRTQDANLSYLAVKLNEAGVQLREARVIPDIEDTIVETVRVLSKHHAYVFTTGGIGPTHDDITSLSVAKAFGVALLRHPEAQRILAGHYPNPADRTAARMKMADIPDGATLVENPVSGAPGFRLQNVFVLAGVPKIMQAMLDSIVPTLKGGRPVQSITVRATIAEGVVAAGLGEIQDRYPLLDIGSYPYFQRGTFGTSLVIRGANEEQLSRAGEEVRELVRALGATILADEDD